MKIRSESGRELLDPTIDVEVAHCCSWSLERLFFAWEVVVAIHFRPASSASGLRCQESS